MLLRPERPEIRYQRARRQPRLLNAQRTVLLNVRPDPIPALAHVAPAALRPHAVLALIRAVVRVARAAVLLRAQQEVIQAVALAVAPIPAVAVHAAAALIQVVALAVVVVIQEEVAAHAVADPIPAEAAVHAQAVPAVLVALSADNKQKKRLSGLFFLLLWSHFPDSKIAPCVQ